LRALVVKVSVTVRRRQNAVEHPLDHRGIAFGARRLQRVLEREEHRQPDNGFVAVVAQAEPPVAGGGW
jgi:hypothetical protein